jgi:hypothetical protein
MFLFGLILGLIVGTIFHAVISKWYNKAKATGTEFAKDVKAEAEKVIK